VENRRSDLSAGFFLKYPGGYGPFWRRRLNYLLEREYALLHSLIVQAFQSRSNSFGVEAQCCIVFEDPGPATVD